MVLVLELRVRPCRPTHNAAALAVALANACESRRDFVFRKVRRVSFQNLLEYNIGKLFRNKDDNITILAYSKGYEEVNVLINIQHFLLIVIRFFFCFFFFLPCAYLHVIVTVLLVWWRRCSCPEIM